MYKRILVPTDGSDITSKAVQSAIAMAKLTGAEVFALAVKEPFPYSAISEMQPVPPQEFWMPRNAWPPRASRPWLKRRPRLA
jgi:nucleotide-binding universal stress UspA family protein